MPNNARLVVVGEAPGKTEAWKGKPFLGPSGQLLDRVLAHHGYQRNEVMLTNVCACRPNDNATPPRTAIAACRGRLMHEIRTSGASDVVALGATAASALVDDARTITALRVGPAKPATAGLADSPVKRVIPTWHPAYCLRNADAFPSLVSDIGKLKDSGRDAWSPPTWRVFDDPASAIAVLGELTDRASDLVVDIEVGIEKDFDFGHPNEYGLLAVGLGYARGKVVVLGEVALRDREVLARLKQCLAASRIIAHNGKFDLGGLYPHIGGQRLWFDTMLASYCMDERPGNHGLKVLAVERLGAPQYDLEIKQFIPSKGNYANIPRAILYKYNAYDVACTWDLYELFREQLERNDLRRVHDFMVEASNELMYLELNGINIDRAYMNQLRDIFIGRLEPLEEELARIVNLPVTTEDPSLAELAPELSSAPQKAFNPRSPKQVKAYLESQNVRVDKTDKDTLERLQELLLKQTTFEHPVVRFVETLLLHRRQQKLFSTYVEGIRKRLYGGRVFTTYMLHGTTSGRLASRNPNLQNIVRDNDIRRQFSVSKPDNIFIQADFKQAEGRVIATLAQDEYLRSIFNDPTTDIFDTLTKELYGATPVSKAEQKEQRIRTKAFFYGLSYGRAAYSIALEYKMSVAEAERRLQDFMSLIPATAAWQQDVRDRVLDGEDLVTSFGRRRRFWLITEQNQKDVLNEALSFLPQSTSSDICLSAFTRLRPMLRGLAFIRLTIHDALVVECPEQHRARVAQLLVAEMEKAGSDYTDYVPFVTDLSYGKNWGEL
jgi:uracil-DNA glycosylase family 4